MVCQPPDSASPKPHPSKPHPREEHSMDQCRSRLKLSENFERHWSILIPGEIHMDQSLVHTFSWGNSYGPIVLKVLLKFPPALVLVHGWLFPAPLQHATSENGSCTAAFGMLRCRSCTATLAFLQCRCHFDQKLRCSKRKTAVQT